MRQYLEGAHLEVQECPSRKLIPLETNRSKFGVGINFDGLLIERSAHAISSVFIKRTFGQLGSFRWSPELPEPADRPQRLDKDHPAFFSVSVSGKS